MNINNRGPPNMRRFGLELELVGLTPGDFYLQNADNYDHRERKYWLGELGFNVGGDSSIKANRSMELKTDPTSLIGLIPPLVKYLKKNSLVAKANLACGMHIHVDFPILLRNSRRTEITTYFNEKWGTKFRTHYRPHPIRQFYCGNGAATASSRYSAVNVCSEYPTIEYRLFNAVLNSRYMCKAIKDAVAVTEDIEQYVSKLPQKAQAATGRFYSDFTWWQNTYTNTTYS